MTGLIPNPRSLIPTARAVSSAFAQWANVLVAATLAPTCAVCHAILDEPLSGCVCSACWASVKVITPPLCEGCGDPLPKLVERCHACLAHDRFVRQARAVGEYDGTLKDIIHAFKYDGRRSLAGPLASLMRSRGAILVEAADCVVPVPLHWRRQHTRGFNQARDLAGYLGPPLVDALVRVRHTRAQVELAAHRRRANVASAFRTSWMRTRNEEIRGMNVLLVDDVCTTGATLESCAFVLKVSGASVVNALTVAKVTARRREIRHASRDSERTVAEPYRAVRVRRADTDSNT